MAIKHLFIVCGEPSGELHAAGLTRCIKELNPLIKISGVGGPLLAGAGASVFYDIKGLAVFGLFDALRKLPHFLYLKKLILKEMEIRNPDAIILVDFSGFNLRLAKAVNKKIPVIYYVSPQVWASRQGRIKTIKRYVSKMVVLFKFEKEFYLSHGIDAEFTGQPLLDTVTPSLSRKEFLSGINLRGGRRTIALLPGSRRQEVEKILPVMLKAGMLIKKELPDIQYVIAKAPQLDWDIYRNRIRGLAMEVRITEGKTYDCLNAADFALVCSGTATLEATILAVPFATVYRMNWLSYLLYLPQVRVPYISMANIVAGKRIIREFIQSEATPQRIAREAVAILESPGELKNLRERLLGVTRLLGEKGAARRAAETILNFLEN
ncbi:MAG: lipid-A-disaccharide synthase [Candidatus Omnitrophota bacterium]